MKINFRYPLIAAGIILLSCLYAFIGTSENKDFALARREMLLRKVGHELLLRSGDKTSRVLPVQKLEENKYQIRFEKEFTFEGDSLRAIVNRTLKEDELSNDYVVSVLSCPANTLIFGYAKSPDEKSSINACSGRIQPKSCYMINVQFKPTAVPIAKNLSLLGGLPILAFVSFLAIKRGLRKNDNAINDQTLYIGNTIFDTVNRQITIYAEVIPLTVKENKLLLILAHALNTEIPRSRLQKEIWEDEGVIVGRSLDMFISKLRKKLEQDPLIQLTNIHGKGYKLEVKTHPD